MILSLLSSDPMQFVAWVVAMVVSLTIHEFSHAYATVKMGDSTPERLGRLTLNPLAHLDFMGTVLLLTVGFGWGKPVPYNPYNIENKRWGEAIIAAAGPLSNLILVIFMLILLKFVVPAMSISSSNMMVIFFFFMLLMNVVLFVFNLIPIPPLDGSKVFFSFLPAGYEHIRMKMEQNGPMILLFLLILDSFSPISVFDWLFSGVFALLYRFV